MTVLCSSRQAAPALGVVLVLASSVMAAIPGPNDLRYPDYIVNPPVRCTQEGSFPHPRNCSWYYRCVDRMSVGYLWTYHFECEPGTVFSDELDQCVHPFDAPYSCRPTPTTTEGPLKCTGVPGTCKTYDICLPSKTKKRMCTEIKCPIRTPNLSCGDGYAFDMDLQECAKIPTAAELCLFTCEGVPETCQTFEVCRPKKEERYMCKEIRCPLREPNLSCGEDYLFDMKSQKCAKPPNSQDLCGGEDISVTDVGLLPCSFNGQIPKADFVKRKFCKDIALCDGSVYKGKTEVCDGYYECEKTAQGWKAHQRSCPAPLLFSFTQGKCILPPSERERC
ncbi:uncharacterized protein [Macrobrachium rosenbergii]|uniref:uncharacterized protein n=1 Tax=Macrobrachium rosenbergii TaxID=79674 RepID=UPI0034D3C216